MAKFIKRIALILVIVFSISIFSACDIFAGNGGTSDGSTQSTATSGDSGSSGSSASASIKPESFSYLGETYGPHITTAAQFSAFYQYAVFYKIGKVQLYLDFLGNNATNDAVSAAINVAKGDVTLTYSCKTSYGCLNKNDMLWQFEFSDWANTDPNNTTKTTYPTEYYTSIVNLTKLVSTEENKREATFDDFKINTLTKTASVTTSEQLYYVVSKGVKPAPTKDSIAETIYNKAKQVLREIVDDTMSDAEKVIAICDWLSENVVYDGKMIELSEGGTDTKRYNAHYLEGVFIDNRAVCDGFSKAFVLLTRIEGIESIMIEGTASGGAHAWNKVNLPKDDVPHWYIVDNTWNNSGTAGDFDPEIPGDENYELWTRAYALVTDSDISTTHHENDNGYPAATGGNVDVDVYKSIVYSGEATLKVTSESKLVDLLRWVKVKISSDDVDGIKFVMIDMDVTYNYGSNFANRISDLNTYYLIGFNMSKIRVGKTMSKEYLIFLL